MVFAGQVEGGRIMARFRQSFGVTHLWLRRFMAVSVGLIIAGMLGTVSGFSTAAAATVDDWPSYLFDAIH